MTKRWTQGLSGLLSAACLITQPAAIYTGSHYTYDDWGKAVPAPESYRVEQVLSGEDCGAGAFSGPEDLFVDEEGRVYVADTGNNRIVVLDAQLRMEKEISSVALPEGDSPLLEPKGVFRTPEGELYICDTGNGRILQLDKDDRYVRTYTRPETSLLSDDLAFQPEKVAVDSGGAVYVVAYGIYQGLVEYGPDGSFTGFFGSNQVELTLEVLVSYFWKQLLSKEQGEALTRTIPTQYANVFIDDQDFLYTATSETETSTDEVKKLNALGVNVLRSAEGQELYDKSNFADLETDQQKGLAVDSRVVDVHVDEDGIISLLDQRRGRIFQYNEDRQLLFVFGNLGEQAGTFSRVTALSKLGDRYLVLDGDNQTLTLFGMTGYAARLREAMGYYTEGRYAESVELWQALLTENSQLSVAYQSIGKALVQQQRYEEAMTYFEKGNDREGYSNALREYRKGWIRANSGWLLAVAAALWIGVTVLRRIWKKRRARRRGPTG